MAKIIEKIFSRFTGLVVCSLLAVVVIYSIGVWSARTIRAYQNKWADCYEKAQRIPVRLDQVGTTHFTLRLPSAHLFSPGGKIYFEITKGVPVQIEDANIRMRITNADNKTVFDNRLPLAYVQEDVASEEKAEDIDLLTHLHEFDSKGPEPFAIVLTVTKPIAEFAGRQQHMYARHVTYGHWYDVSCLSLLFVSLSIWALLLLLWLIALLTRKERLANVMLAMTILVGPLLLILTGISWNTWLALSR